MAIKDVDIFISGGGIAGLTAAASLSQLGFTVLLADPTAPPKSADQNESDLRSTALLAPACDLLDRVGVWEELAPFATALDRLRILDCRGESPSVVTERLFEASDLNEPHFGWNLPNWRTRKVLAAHVEASDLVETRFGTGFRSIVTRDGEAVVTLSDGSRIRAGFAIAADGRNSALREAVDINVQTTRYGQKVLAFVVAHELPHDNVSTELYLSGGAFTLVPLADIDGTPASAVVWMEHGPEATRLAGLNDQDFSEAATARSCEVLGPLRVVGRRAIWPVVTQIASRFTAKRVALVAEAAHVMPPIGAQGLNTSLQDISTLVSLAETDPNSIGSAAFLGTYENARLVTLQRKSTIIDLYNRICRSDQSAVQDLRSLGLRIVHDLEPLRRATMRAGLGENA